MKKVTRGLLFLLLLQIIIIPIQAPIAHGGETQFVFETQTSQAPEVAPSPQTTPEPIPEPTPEPKVYGKTNTKGVNVRVSASTKAEKVATLASTGSFVEILGEETVGSDIWYSVLLDNEATGYIRSDLLDKVEEATYLAALEEQALSKSTASSNTSKASSSSGQTVYVTSSGKSYHRTSSCSNMSSPKSMTVEQAINSGRTKCSKCW